MGSNELYTGKAVEVTNDLQYRHKDSQDDLDALVDHIQTYSKPQILRLHTTITSKFNTYSHQPVNRTVKSQSTQVLETLMVGMERRKKYGRIL